MYLSTLVHDLEPITGVTFNPNTENNIICWPADCFHQINTSVGEEKARYTRVHTFTRSLINIATRIFEENSLGKEN